MSVTGTAPSLDRLLRAISLAERTTYFFVLCDHPEDETAAVGILSEALGERAQVITLDAQSNDLLRVIRNLEPPVRDRDVLLITRMEAVVSHDTSDESRFLTNLNAARDTIKRYAPVPIVFFVPHFVLAAISRRAPDFFSTSSGIFQFEQRAERRRSLYTIEQDDEISVLNLSTAEQSQRIHELRDLLESEHIAPRRKVRVAARLARLLIARGALDEALSLAIHYAEKARAQNDREAELLLLVRIGHVLFLRQRMQDAVEILRAAAEVARKAGYLEIAARALNLLGLVYVRLDRTQEANEAFHTAIDFAEKNGAQSPTALVNLANLRSEITHEERIDLLRRAYELTIRSGDAIGAAVAAHSLAVALFEAGRLDQALTLLTEAVAAFEAGDQRLPAARALGAIGYLEAIRHNFEASEMAYRRALGHLEDLPTLASDRASIMGSLAVLNANRGDFVEATEWGRLALEAIETARHDMDVSMLGRIDAERDELLSLMKTWSNETREPLTS